MGQSPKDSSSWSANEGRAKLKAEGEKLSASAGKRARRAEIGETEVNGVSYGEGVERKESPLTGVEDLVCGGRGMGYQARTGGGDRGGRARRRLFNGDCFRCAIPVVSESTRSGDIVIGKIDIKLLVIVTVSPEFIIIRRGKGIVHPVVIVRRFRIVFELRSTGRETLTICLIMSILAKWSLS